MTDSTDLNSTQSTLMRVQINALHADERLLLRGLDWAIEAGQVWSIVGTNGCGKSTLLKYMAGLTLPHGLRLVGTLIREPGKTVSNDLTLQQPSPQEPSSQQTRADQKLLKATIKPPPDPEFLSWMPQSDALSFDCLVRERVLVGRYGRGKFWGWDTQEDEQELARALQAMDLAGMGDRLLSSLSGGERRRTSLAGALLQDARLTLLDEPMSQLDWAHQIQLGRLIRTWPGLDQKALVWVTHDPNMALRFSTHLLAIGPDGQTWQGSVCDMARPEVFEKVYGCCIEASRDPFLFFPKIEP